MTKIMKDLIYQNLEDSFVDGVSEAVANNGGLADVNPFRNDQAPEIETIDFIANESVKIKMPQLFAQELGEVKTILKETLYSILGNEGYRMEDIKIENKDLNKILSILMGED
jgi:hypothetical protein